MFYYLFEYIEKTYDLIGAGVFQYISFRAGCAAIMSLVITIFLGKKLILFFYKKKIKEGIRELDIEGQERKKETPTMGGIIIIGAILIPTLCFAKLDNIYIILLIGTTIWLGFIGLIDDYIKVFKKNKQGLAGRFKVVGQMVVGLFVGLTLYFHNDVTIRQPASATEKTTTYVEGHKDINSMHEDVKSTKTTVPFLKNNELDYSRIFPFLNGNYTWIIYTLVVMFIVTAVSNGANLTDGIDGLVSGTSAIIGLIIAIFAYLSGRVDFSAYLNIMYIPDVGELVIFCTAFVGACLGFLWYNAFPAQIFMGDTGSLMLGGVIAVLALTVRKELMLPLICGVFLIETLSVVVQVFYFKYTRTKYGEGRRILRMSPLHHHYQKIGIHESKIVVRFWIIGILLGLFSLATLKLR